MTYLNSRSLLSIYKGIPLTILITLHNPDVVSICENWFDDNFVDNVSLSPDYITATRADRKTGEHEVVFNLCKHTVKFEALKMSCCDFAFAVNLHSNQSLLIIICVYYPPRGSQYKVDWTNNHASIHQPICTHNFKIIITGDFSERNVDWNSFSTTNVEFEDFLDFMIQYSMHQLIFPLLILRAIYLMLLKLIRFDVFLPQKSHKPVALSL